MKRTIIFLVLISTVFFAYGQSITGDKKDSENKGLEFKMTRFSYLSYGINNTKLIGSFLGLGLGQVYENEEHKFRAISASGTYIGDFIDKYGGRNQDYRSADAQFQTFISLNANIMVYKYFNLNEKYSFGIGIGVDFLYSPGQSIKFNNLSGADLLGRDSYFFNFVPEIYFRSEKGISYLFDTPVEFYVNYNISINSQRVFTDNTTPNYKYSFVGIGLRFDIFE